MSTGLLFDYDEQVAQYLTEFYKWERTLKYERAIGLLKNGNLCGAIILHGYNGANIELSYYGEATITAGVVRTIARFLICTFHPSRLTVVTSKRNKRFIRSFQRLGFRIEGVQRRYYGEHDNNRNAGVRFVMFRERIEEIAKFAKPLIQASK